MTRLLLALLLLAACGGASPEPQPPAPQSKASCATAATRLADQFAQALEGMPDAAAQRDAMQADLTSVCEADGWSAATIDCFSAAPTMTDVQACTETLTPDQRAGMASLGGEDAPE